MWGRRKESITDVGNVEALPPQVITDSSRVVKEIGQRLAESLWPAKAEVHLANALPLVCYPETDFKRLMNILITGPLEASATEGNPQVLIGSRSDNRVTVFSIHSPLTGAFKNCGPAGDNGVRPVEEARQIVRRNGGHFWIDEKFGPGSIAYFTLPVGRIDS